MALKIDFITGAVNKIKQAFTDGANNSTTLKEGGNVGLLQSAADKIGTAVAASINALASIWTKFTTAVTDGVNASNGLKEGGNVNVLNVSEIQRRIKEEGQPFSVPFVTSNQTFGTGVTSKSLNGGVMIYPGFSYIPKNASLGINISGIGCYINIGTGAPTGLLAQQVVGMNSISVSNDLHPIGECSSINALVDRTVSTDDSATPFSARGGVSGVLIGKDYDKITDFAIKLIGDSNMQNSAWITSVRENALFQGIVKEYFETAASSSVKSKTARNIYKAKGGINSTNLVNMLLSGELTVSQKIDLTLMMIGTNNVIQAYNANGNALTQGQITTLVNTYVADMTILIDRHIKRYGNAQPLIIMGPLPIANVVQEAAMVQLRDAGRALCQSKGCGIWNGGSVAIAKPANNIYWMSPGAQSTSLGGVATAGAYVATDTTKYISEASLVHINASGHADVSAQLINMFQVNNITL